MKPCWIVLFCSTLLYGRDSIDRMLDPKSNATQRNDACYELRGNRSAEVVAAMRSAMANEKLRACAARNLREAGAIEELKSALADSDPEVRAAAARELGATELPELMPLLAEAALDSNALAALNAVDGLAQYQGRDVLPFLLGIAAKGNMAGVAALRRAAEFGDPAVVPVARQYLTGADIGAQVIALQVIGRMGDASDLTALRQVAAKARPMSQNGRGFGLMPGIDLGQVARNAIDQIERRIGLSGEGW
jgi:HEAT repeat protein